MSKMPKLAVLSQAQNSRRNNNDNNNNNTTITVVVCPKSNASIRLTENEKQTQYPYYDRLCKNYGFSLEVEIILQQTSSSSSAVASRRGGPTTSHVLLMNNNNNTAANSSINTSKKKLHHHSERLIIRPLPSSSRNKKTTNNELRPDFQSGDILQSIDGIDNPTFGMVYALMMRGDKLLLEIVRAGVKQGNPPGADATAAVSSAVVGVAGTSSSSTSVAVAAASTTTTTTTTTTTMQSGQTTQQQQHLQQETITTTNKKKRQVCAWDAENRRVQREQKKLQREREKERERLQQQQQQLLHSSKKQQQQQPPPLLLPPANNNKKSKSSTQKSTTSTTTINVLPPSYITKAVAQLEKNVEELNRKQREEEEEEEVMYGVDHQIVFDYTLANEHTKKKNNKESVDKEGEEEGEVMRNEMPHVGGVDNAPSISTLPTVDLTLLDDDNHDHDDDENDDGGRNENGGDDFFSIVNSLGCSSSDVQKEVTEELPIRSSSIARGNNDSPSSSASSLGSSSSSSSSDSDSSSSDNNCISEKSSKQPPQTITTSAGGATDKPMSTPPRNNNHRRFTSISDTIATAMVVEQLPTAKRPRSSSSVSTNDGGKSYPTYSSAMSYPNRSNTAQYPKTGLNEAPTSLNRLWPDPSDIVKALTSWKPPSATVKHRLVEFYGEVSICNMASLSVGNRENDKRASSNPLLHTTTSPIKEECNEYKNANEMMESLARPLIEEGLASINNDYHSNKHRNGRWNRDTHRLVVTKITPVTPIFEKKSSFFGEHITMYEIQFSLKGETNIPPSNLSELYCLHYHRWKSCKIGIVGHDFPTTITFRTYSESNSMLKLFVCVDESLKEEEEEGKTGWLSKHDFRALFDPHKFGVPHPDAVLTLMSVGSTINIVRQYEAISSVGHLKPHIQKALFSSRVKISPKPAEAAVAIRPRSLPTDIWTSLQKNHNPYQLSSISKVVSGSCKNNICLIQGPPGTGKSSTIVGIVSALLSGKAPLPGQRQSGCLIHPGKTMGVTRAEPLARNRILVCAATNIAVDTIAWKIKQGSIGPSGKVGDFKMARFGSLPWDRDEGRDGDYVKAKRPPILSEMEQFLYAINVDRRASDGIQSHFYNNYDDEEQDDYKCWTPDGKQAHPKRKRRKRVVGRGTKRKEIIAESSVVVTTLSGAGSKAFIDAACRDNTRNDSEFDAVIIDEACVASESETLIPFKFNPTTITLVGDPRQLPVLSLATNQSNKSLYERSLFERMQNLQWPTILLRQQYRMHQEIATFPSNQFYDGKLITSESVKNRLLPPWANDPYFPTICFWDTKRAGHNGAHDFTNADESVFILRRIMTAFVCKYSGATFADDSNNPVSVGIISFYKDQVKSLQEQWKKIPSLKTSEMNVKISTVDGFQGSECDVVILSCVRSRNMKGKNTNSIGFLSDERRMNVALTRAKRSLWVVGDSDVLKANHIWKRLIDHFEREGMLRDGSKQDEFQWETRAK